MLAARKLFIIAVLLCALLTSACGGNAAHETVAAGAPASVASSQSEPPTREQPIRERYDSAIRATLECSRTAGIEVSEPVFNGRFYTYSYTHADDTVAIDVSGPIHQSCHERHLESVELEYFYATEPSPAEAEQKLRILQECTVRLGFSGESIEEMLTTLGDTEGDAVRFEALKDCFDDFNS